MRHEVILGAERRRRWSDEAKLGILREVGVDGWTVSDVARHHDLTRQHIYQWRRELRRKGLWPDPGGATFLPVEMAAVAEETVRDEASSAGRAEIAVILRNGRELRCDAGIEEAMLTRLIRAVEAA